MIDFLCNTVEVATREQSLLGAVIMGKKVPIVNYDWWTIGISAFAFLAGLGSFIYARLTYNEQQKTVGLVDKSKAQYVITINLVRHLYRNFVVALAIDNKMRSLNYKVYPAEIHLQKAKIPLDDVRLESFSGRNVEAYTAIYNWTLLARNYNMELDTAMRHFAKKKLDVKVKEYDIKTLLLKPGLLAYQLVEMLARVYEGEYSLEKIKNDAIEIIFKSHKNNVEMNKWGKIGDFELYYNESNHFLQIFKDREDEFFDMLNEDAKIECGKNTEGEDKLLFIEL